MCFFCILGDDNTVDQAMREAMDQVIPVEVMHEEMESEDSDMDDPDAKRARYEDID